MLTLCQHLAAPFGAARHRSMSLLQDLSTGRAKNQMNRAVPCVCMCTDACILSYLHCALCLGCCLLGEVCHTLRLGVRHV